MKKACTLFCMILVILSTISTSALAAEGDRKVIDLGDGYYVVETITYFSVGRSQDADTVQGSKSDDVYIGSTKIGTATLFASFDISGSTARATSARISGTGYNGASYRPGATTVSGNKASGTACFTYNGMPKEITLSLTCSPDGRIS